MRLYPDVCVCVCVTDMLLESPALLEVEDIEDLFSLAQYYYSKTPLSLRKVRCGSLTRTGSQTRSLRTQKKFLEGAGTPSSDWRAER